MALESKKKKVNVPFKLSFLKKFQSCSKIASKLFMNVVSRLFPTFLAKNSHRDLRVSSFIISSS